MESIKHNLLTDRQNDSASNKIQVLRGLAIIAVVFIHNTPGGLPQVVLRPFLNFCSGLFLFLSGMQSDAEKWNPKKRISKVLIPYVIWTLIYVVMSFYQSPLQIPVVFLKQLLLGKAAWVMYYIFVYCEFTLLIPWIDRLARSKYRYWGFAVAPAEIVLMRLLPMVMGVSLNQYIRAVMGISCLAWFTYFYLGYLVGNGIIQVNRSPKKLLLVWALSIAVQIGEGFWYLHLGEANCGTQMKLSAIASGAVFSVMAYQFIYSKRECRSTVLKRLGDISFGIFFSHMAVMTALGKIPYYRQLTPYPVNAIAVIAVSSFCVCLGRKLLGKYAKYMAL